MPVNATTPQSIAIGEVIREIRKDAKLTAQELADRIGCSQQRIAMWEMGNRSPSVVDIPAIASAFRKSPLWLARKIFDRLPK